MGQGVTEEGGTRRVAMRTLSNNLLNRSETFISLLPRGCGVDSPSLIQNLISSHHFFQIITCACSAQADDKQ